MKQGVPKSADSARDTPENALTDGRFSREETITALRRNWRAEAEGAATYRELARMERDERRREILNKMAEAEERHAGRWAERIAALSGHAVTENPADIGPSSAIILSARVGSIDIALGRIEAVEDEHVRACTAQLATLDDPESTQILEELIQDESSHARGLRAITRPSAEPRSRLDSILRRER